MSDIKHIDKIVLVLAIGLCEALRSKSITNEDAMFLLFKPRVMELMNYSPEIREIIFKGTNFHDISRLIPDRLDDKIDDAKRAAEAILKDLPPLCFDNDFWLDSFLTIDDRRN